MYHFDPQLLQTLVTFAETGSLSQVAQLVGRTPSAVTAQIQRLEHAAGVPLLKSKGRRRVLTPSGEQLVFHARHILAAQREAWLSVHGETARGSIVLGLTQDFAGDPLPGILNQFARTHPQIRIEIRVGRSSELSLMFAERQLDLLIAARHLVEADELAVFQEEMLWITSADGLAHVSEGRLPLALLDEPCLFRKAGIRALEACGRSFRIVSSSQSLAGIEPSIKAGIAVTVRTARFLGNGIGAVSEDLDLPPLGTVEFSIRLRKEAAESARYLSGILAAGLQKAGPI